MKRSGKGDSAVPLIRHRLTVRFSDCDPLGHVNNAVYFTYLEQARFTLWRAQLGFMARPAVEGGQRGVGFILARAECDFKSQARYGDELEVRLSLSGVGRTSFSYEYEIVDAVTERLVASARTVQVLYDYDSETPAAIGRELRDQLSRPAPNRRREASPDPSHEAHMTPPTLIFGKDACPYTVAAREDYERRQVAFEYINVKKNPADLERMLQYSGGQRRVPVIVEAGKVTIGFGGT